MNGRKLPLSFQKYGYTFHQVERTKNAAIYRQVSDRKTSGYEVIKIRIAKESTFKGKHYPEREVYPSTAQWGKLGWSIKTYERAEEKYLEISKN